VEQMACKASDTSNLIRLGVLTALKITSSLQLRFVIGDFGWKENARLPVDPKS
jgi:hypothetical protein